MARDLFGDVTRPFAGVGARSRLTVPVSLAAHACAVAALVVVPLLASDALPSLRETLSVNVVTPVVPPPPPVRRIDQVVPPSNSNAAPADAPTGIRVEPALVPVDAGVNDPSLVTGPIGTSRDLTPPPSAPPVDSPPPPVRPGGSVAPPMKIHDAAPVYPAIAQAARVQGVVIIEATIDTSGAVVDARVLRSVPLLDQAALEAVRQWRYVPTRLNGQPVAVIMTVTVRFQLG